MTQTSTVRAAVPRRFDVDAVAFDLDGTLLDTVGDIAAALDVLLREQGLPALPVTTVRDLIGRGMADLIEGALRTARGRPIAPAEVSSLLGRYQVIYGDMIGTHTQPYPGALRALSQLRAAGKKLAIVTNKATRFVAPHLALAGMSDAFNAVVGGDDATAKKPDAAPMLLAAHLLGVEPHRMLMVGDSINDVMAARAAGCPVLLLPHGYSEGRPVQSLGSDGIVESLAEIVPFVIAG